MILEGLMKKSAVVEVFGVCKFSHRNEEVVGLLVMASEFTRSGSDASLFSTQGAAGRSGGLVRRKTLFRFGGKRSEAIRVENWQIRVKPTGKRGESSVEFLRRRSVWLGRFRCRRSLVLAV